MRAKGERVRWVGTQLERQVQAGGKKSWVPANPTPPTKGVGAAAERAAEVVSGGGAGALGSLGMNIPTFQLGMGALGSLANIYGGFQANKLAKDQLNFTKQITNTNLNNQIKSYNTALEDRARSRATAENRDQDSADAYIEKNKLSR